MIKKVTKGISITVVSQFEGVFFKTYQNCFNFTYTVRIKNDSNDSVQILSRYWEVLDALNFTGVEDQKDTTDNNFSKPTSSSVNIINRRIFKTRGEKLVIKPGDVFSYNSNSIISSPFGIMKGYFKMISLSSTKRFRVYIPEFKLSASFALN